VLGVAAVALALTNFIVAATGSKVTVEAVAVGAVFCYLSLLSHLYATSRPSGKRSHWAVSCVIPGLGLGLTTVGVVGVLNPVQSSALALVSVVTSNIVVPMHLRWEEALEREKDLVGRFARIGHNVEQQSIAIANNNSV